MLKTSLIFFILLFVGAYCLAQPQIERSLISTQGGIYQGDFHLDFSIGEVLTTTYQSAIHLTQGFQQGDFNSVALSSIDITLKGERVNEHFISLEWEMDFIPNEGFFQIERTTHSDFSFSKIGSLSVNEQHFHFEDKGATSSAYYYRISLLSSIGKTVFSNIIRIEEIHPFFQIFPNPFDDVLIIKKWEGSGHEAFAIQAQLWSQDGKLVAEKTFESSEEWMWKEGLKSLSKGMYRLIVICGEEKRQYQIVKK